ncbi:hypothetical protein [Micromonospora auratinigra]|uniref:hypothetical protein n=1 Tax=Micromonospora auratinigra TaxID=261654 RepID=UPI00142FA0EB|nr:hypothetical protein [Micromonospora auratinigra]
MDRVDRPVLERLVALPGRLAEADAYLLHERTAWPVAVVERDGRLAGFLMRQVPPTFETPLRLTTRYVQKLAQVQLLLNNETYLAARDLAIDDLFRLGFLLDTARAMADFHRIGLAVGDLSPNNLLFSRGAAPRCFFLDCDAVRLDGASALPQIETTDWEVAGGGGEELATPASDAYKFTLLCVRLLAGNQSTRDPAAAQRAGADIRELVDRGLDPVPTSRPGLTEWTGPLERAIEAARTRPRIRPATLPPAPDPGIPGTASTAAGPSPAGANRPPGRPAPTRAPTRPPAASRPVTRSPRRAGAAGKVALAVVLLLCGVTRISSCVGGPHSGPAAEERSTGASDDLRRPSTAARAQAAALAEILSRSKQDRRTIAPAVEKVTRCVDPTGAAADFRQAGAGRRDVLRRVTAIETDELPHGAELRSNLVSALSHSAAADDAYSRWARAVARHGCRSSAMRGTDRKTGDRESRAATEAKQRFVALWNPVARQSGDPVLSYRDI